MKVFSTVASLFLLTQFSCATSPVFNHLPFFKASSPTPMGRTSRHGVSNAIQTAQAPVIVNSDQFPGSDVGSRIAAAQLSLHNAPGIITVSRADTLSQPVTLAAGNGLQIAATIIVTAPVTLSGNNAVTCVTGGAFTSQRDIFTGNKGAGNLSVTGCTVHSTNSKATFFNTSGSNIVVEQNNVTGMALMNAQGGDSVTVDGNTMTGIEKNFNPVIWGSSVTNASFTHNNCNTVYWCFTFFNADANSPKISSRAAVAAFGGHYTISGNHCTNVNACYWGSVAHDVTMTANYASNCDDVCYDVEGCIDVLFSANQGDNGANGVGATFYFADHVTFDKNVFSNPNGRGIIFVHNVTRAPANNQFLSVTNNTLTCVSTICSAVGGDPAGNLLIANNTIQDGTIQFGSNLGSAEIQHNTFKFSIVSSKPFDAISNGLLINSAVYNIADNTFTSPAQPAGSNCIKVNAGDYNSSSQVTIVRNDTAGFPVDILTNNDGGNVGTQVLWNISANHVRGGVIHHTHNGSDKDSYNETGNILGNR